MIIRYPCTNECIHAVIARLDLKPSDTVVAIASSGDMPLAIAPYVQKVYAVDRNKDQIRFTREQIERIREEDDGFYHLDLFARMILKEEKNIFLSISKQLDMQLAK